MKTDHIVDNYRIVYDRDGSFFKVYLKFMDDFGFTYYIQQSSIFKTDIMHPLMYSLLEERETEGNE